MMWGFYLGIIPFLLLNFHSEAGLVVQNIGDPCQLKTGGIGYCTNLTNCTAAIHDINAHGKGPSYCTFTGYELIVCCDDSTTKNITTSFLSRAMAFPPSTENTELSEDEMIKIAKKKCSQYSSIVEYIEHSRGKVAKIYEFPHMAQLGYGTEDIEYKCGASLISEEFLLTSAHCLKKRDGAPLTVAKLGKDDRSEIIVNIKERIPHPKWDRSQAYWYHDIALLRLEKPILKKDFNFAIRPACIQTDEDIEETEGIATGWGVTRPDGPVKLLKVQLPFMDNVECSRTYQKNWYLNKGSINGDSMICAGGVDIGEDTCPGDSGGPLQIRKSYRIDTDLEQIHCSIVGITSYEPHNCNIYPGVYTRVSHYVPWIVSNVWRDEVESIKTAGKYYELDSIRPFSLFT